MWVPLFLSSPSLYLSSSNLRSAARATAHPINLLPTASHAQLEHRPTLECSGSAAGGGQWRRWLAVPARAAGLVFSFLSGFAFSFIGDCGRVGSGACPQSASADVSIARSGGCCGKGRERDTAVTCSRRRRSHSTHNLNTTPINTLRPPVPN